MNKIILTGNVGRDPEMRYTPSGAAVTNFSLAVNRRYTPQSGEPQEETEWFDITAWNRLAETCNNYVHRGMKVGVIGRVHLNTYIGQDGVQRARMVVTAQEVEFLSSANRDNSYQGEQDAFNRETAQTNEQEAAGVAEGHEMPENPDDLPW